MVPAAVWAKRRWGFSGSHGIVRERYRRRDMGQALFEDGDGLDDGVGEGLALTDALGAAWLPHPATITAIAIAGSRAPLTASIVAAGILRYR